ncbi:uncharacterized protein ACLA_059970 [Aspergillus clavatus NRRL 1]|uniref:Uncharacterized protein n=1 Tax=Aspergillus clavatus (strain ATCC 1007 / CBS 513.65 / DSM 816 / NCTC 3887 / NRRL 1 / QM 1276 / 107) TaxID=344612 RepID=A1C4J0_ASPCL|nr:uncharacterized protein ACLA_059970 [Aspergillus clavatus NRRL 1]EAW15330.1 hypothetical protein ACLA_059970 [Aspergillus clavatus NRRL 1]
MQPYVGKLGNAYFYDNPSIKRPHSPCAAVVGGITAWKGTNTTFENKYGVYIVDSQVLAANSSIVDDIKGMYSLRRP